MSKGLGGIQRRILEIAASAENHAWTVTQLCELIYPGINRVEKKHRVAVLERFARWIYLRCGQSIKYARQAASTVSAIDAVCSV